MSLQAEQLNTEFSAILAGGQSRRFGGEPKALALLDNVPIIVRAQTALERAGTQPHLITNSPSGYAFLDLPMRGDEVPGRGPASGLMAALRWASERNRKRALCVACDMPFLSADLMRELVRQATASAAHVVVPESFGPLGIEPLCAVYSTRALPLIEDAVRCGDASLQGLLTSMDTVRMPLRDVRRFGDPRMIFSNVNTQEQLDHASEMLAGTQNDQQHDLR